TQAGTTFVFGFLGGGPQPFEERPGASSFVLAFRALPLILVISALSSLLFYWRGLPPPFRATSVRVGKGMGVGGAVGGSGVAPNILRGYGQTPPLRPPLSKKHGPRRALHRQALRLGGPPGQGDGDLRDRPLAGSPRRDGSYSRRVSHQHSGRDPYCRSHGTA